MIPTENLALHLDPRKKMPFAEQIQNQLRELIQAGKLRPNDQLPAVRQLAFQLKINFNTVARAYRGLDMEGWITTQQGRGTYVLENIPVPVAQSEAPDEAASSPDQNQSMEASPQQALTQTGSAEENLAAQDRLPANPLPAELDIELVTRAPALEPIPAWDTSADDTVAKASAQAQWIARWLNEADQLGIPPEQMRRAIDERINRLAAKEAAVQAPRPGRRHFKINRKPLFQRPEIPDLWDSPDQPLDFPKPRRQKINRRNKPER